MRITLKNLKRDYGTLHAVQDVSLSIPSNRIYGIIGRSGAGKSTLVRLISMLEKPDSGEVWYDDDRVDNLSKEEQIQRRRRIGMIFQNFNLFSSRNALENIAYPMEICHMDKAYIRQRSEELLKLVGLEGREKAPISTLSGGQKQRVAIARALAVKPDNHHIRVVPAARTAVSADGKRVFRDFYNRIPAVGDVAGKTPH